MDLFFFYNSLPKGFENSENRCFLWYKKGLLSYRQIGDVISVGKLFIETAVFNDFKKDYEVLLSRYEFEIFDTASASIAARPKDKVAFLASNDTILYLLRKIVSSRKHAGLFAKVGEGAKRNADRLGLKCREVVAGIPGFRKYDLLVLGNDWGLLEQKLNYDFLGSGRNTICIQESVIDFNPAEQRMRHCSFPVFQGVVSLKDIELEGRVCAVIGNPRYEDLAFSPVPSEKKVLINVNFTYGIFEEVRESWLKDILSACSVMSWEYLISQHPRDTGDLKAYNLVQTNASNVHDVLQTSSLLITRFSSLIHESLLMGRPVIYYNPHGEKLFYDFEPDNKCLFFAHNTEELVAAMRAVNNASESDTFKAFGNYLNRHLGITSEGLASAYINELIDKAAYYPVLKKGSLKRKMLFSLKVIKRKLLKQRT